MEITVYAAQSHFYASQSPFHATEVALFDHRISLTILFNSTKKLKTTLLKFYSFNFHDWVAVVVVVCMWEYQLCAKVSVMSELRIEEDRLELR